MSAPTRFTAPLVVNDQGLPVYSDGYRLVEFVNKYVPLMEGKPFTLDEWQSELLIRVLEKYPPSHPKAGQLRYRQVVVSIPRQAGKSVLAALLGLYGLLQHTRGPRVLGLARTVEQANIVFNRAKECVDNSPALSKHLHTTGTRGIRLVSGSGTYRVLPAKAEAIQGYPSTLAIVDELHVLDSRIWDTIVTSQRAQVGSVVIGITTAGDDRSILLKRLYELGANALAETNEETERFGFFVYEALSDELSVETIIQANPAAACGRIDAQTIYNDEASTPATNWKRYVLNLFVDGVSEPWVPVADWQKCAGSGIGEYDTKQLVWCIDSAPGMDYASISVAYDNGSVIETELVASYVQPSLDLLYREVLALRKKHGRGTWVMYGYTLGDLATRLQERGMEVVTIRGDKNAKAAAFAYGAIKRHMVSHNDDELLKVQHSNVRIVNRDSGFILDRHKGRDIDGVMSMVYAVYVAGTQERKGFLVA